MFAGLGSTFDFLEKLDGYIHVEVRKLYADAELPKFQKVTPAEANKMVMVYRSSRVFADLAAGLMAGCAAHFGEQITITREDSRPDRAPSCASRCRRLGEASVMGGASPRGSGGWTSLIS